MSLKQACSKIGNNMVIMQSYSCAFCPMASDIEIINNSIIWNLEGIYNCNEMNPPSTGLRHQVLPCMHKWHKSQCQRICMCYNYYLIDELCTCFQIEIFREIACNKNTPFLLVLLMNTLTHHFPCEITRKIISFL